LIVTVGNESRLTVIRAGRSGVANAVTVNRGAGLNSCLNRRRPHCSPQRCSVWLPVTLTRAPPTFAVEPARDGGRGESGNGSREDYREVNRLRMGIGLTRGLLTRRSVESVLDRADIDRGELRPCHAVDQLPD
jgi:hypothetical protein